MDRRHHHHRPRHVSSPFPEKREFEISWPNILYLHYVYRPELSLDVSAVERLVLHGASETVTIAQLAPMVEGKPDMTRWSEIDLNEIAP